jgi:hypothetical protein
MSTVGPRCIHIRGLRLLLVLLLSAATSPSLRAQSNAEFDDYKVRIGGFWSTHIRGARSPMRHRATSSTCRKTSVSVRTRVLPANSTGSSLTRTTYT